MGFESLPLRYRCSLPMTSSLILKSIRQRLMTVCRYVDDLSSECNEQHFSARNQTNIIQTQCFFKLRECSIKKRWFLFCIRSVLRTLLDFVVMRVNTMNNTVLRT